MNAILDDIHSGAFNFDFLLAFAALFLWLRLLSMLSLTEVFGPLIVIVSKMMQDLLIFFGLFVIQLITFAAVGVLIFGDIAEYDDI